LGLFYHIDCFKCSVCQTSISDGNIHGTDVRVRNSRLHCHNCFSNEEGVKFSCVWLINLRLGAKVLFVCARWWWSVGCENDFLASESLAKSLTHFSLRFFPT
jgi:hypothetical protein